MTDLAARVANLTPEQRAALAARLAAAPAQPRSVPVAVIGLGCRFPGGATSPEAFWDRLMNGFDAIREVPSDRWSVDRRLPAEGTAPDAASPRWGGFLDSIDRFDRAFFGLSPREAVHMDPQQRLLLETAWEALEDAGQMTSRLAQSATGVFIGVQSHSSDYYTLQARSLGSIDTYTATGTAHSILANRLSFLFDLRGPSMAIDTACSSSLVAVHSACQSLRTSECDLAVAGGVNLMLTPDFSVCLGSMEMMAPDGRCKTFDQRADGFVRGEGCGVVVLKRLADANRDHDPVLAVILGSAVNQDGASNGLTAPNGLAQQQVIRRALDVAQIAPERVTYVETHGTGTQLGDPIEVEALAKVLRPNGPGLKPCILGAVKTNIGHLEAASGIAGLIKAVLSLKNETIPANLHLDALNAHLADNACHFTLPATARPWPRADEPRVAGVSSFGFGGTNAHVVLSEAPAPPPESLVTTGAPLLLPLSARSGRALRDLTRASIAFLKSAEGARMAPADLAYTAGRRRIHHDYRACAVGASTAEWAESLELHLAEGSDAIDPGDPAEIVFAFSGQGGQNPQAGSQLLVSEPVFRRVVEACDAALRSHSSLSLIDAMRAPASQSQLARADIGQPALFALQAGLDALWRAWGVQPSKVVGHSVGEIAAAHAAGTLGLEEAVRVAFHRGRIVQEAAGLGGMAAIGQSPEQAQMLIASADPSLCVAAVNSPASVVLSGSVSSLHALVAALQERGVFAKMLEIDYPSHSPQMEPFARALEAALSGLTPRRPQLAMVSTVTGGVIEAVDAAYWGRNLRQPVLFAEAIATLVKDGASTFLEVGPHPVLRPVIEQCATASSGRLTIATSLTREQVEQRAMREGAAMLYSTGASLDWTAMSPNAGQCVQLPRYPWDRQRYWLPSVVASNNSAETDGGAARLSDEAAPADWFYQLSWQTAGQLPREASGPAPFDVERLAKDLTPLVAKLSPTRADGWARRDRLAVTSAHHIAKAFKTLGADFSAGAVWASPSLPRFLGVDPRFDRLLQRMAGILVETGTLRARPGEWRVVIPPSTRPADEQRRAEGDDTLAMGLLSRCGAQLAGVLQGQVEPLSLLFPGDGWSSASAIYRDTAQSARANQVLTAGLVNWLASLPADRSLRVLEIGAGTGATTAHVLPKLPQDRSAYVFTDVSPYFLRQAAQSFAAYNFVRYETLDLEQPPATQGFSHGTFDLIIASNVLHATRDIRASLGHVSELLAEGGLLALVECTSPRSWMDITFGLTDGWWRFTDLDLRQTHPLLNASQWIDLLDQCGLDVASVPLQGSGGDPLFDQTLLLAGKRNLQQKTDATPGHDVEQSGRTRFLVLDGGCDVADALAVQLRTRGDACLLVRPAYTFSWTGPQAIQADFQAPADLERVLEAAGPGTRAVIYLPPQGPVDLTTLCDGPLALMQTLVDKDFAAERGLWIVTRGCQPCGDISMTAAGQSLLWGLVRGASLEAPRLAATLLDLDPKADASEAAACLLVEISHPAREDQIVVRGRARYVPRIEPRTLEGSRAGRLTMSGRHLITGGLGGIGAQLALELCRAGAGELVLLVNRPLPDRSGWDAYGEHDEEFRRIETVRRIESQGVKVLVRALDLCDERALRDLLGSPEMTDTPLQGVWHTAMSLKAQDLGDLEPDNLRSMIAVKARTAQQLHDLTRHQPLQHFVLFSSTTALLGARGFAHYAAANAFLDTLAHARRAEGRPAAVVNWGVWEGADRLSRTQQDQAKRAGLRPMPASQAFAALRKALTSGSAQTIIADIAWDRFKSVYEAERLRPLLANIGHPGQRRENGEGEERPEGDLNARISAASVQDRVEVMRAFVQQTLGSVLGLDDTPIDRRAGFFELGMDSLTAVQMRRRLEKGLKRPLLSTVMFKYPTIDALSEHLIETFFEADPHASAAVTEPPTAALSRRPSLPDPGDASEDELFELLAARLSPSRV